MPNSAAMTSSRGRPRWGDTLDDDDVLPPPSVKGPDDNGIKIVTEYFRNDKGDAIKKTCKLKVVVVEKKVFKVRSWAVAASRLSAAAQQQVQRGAASVAGMCPQQLGQASWGCAMCSRRRVKRSPLHGRLRMRPMLVAARCPSHGSTCKCLACSKRVAPGSVGCAGCRSRRSARTGPSLGKRSRRRRRTA